MKQIKSLCLLLIALCFFASIVSAQETINPSAEIKVVKYTDTTGTTIYDGSYHTLSKGLVWYNIGHADSLFSDSETELTYRSIYEFDVSDIPSYATITSVQLKAKIAPYAFSTTAKLTNVGSNPIYIQQHQTNYNKVASGSSLGNIDVDDVEHTVTINGLSSTIIDAVDGGSGSVYIGVKSNSENTHNSTSTIAYVQLVVNYSADVLVKIENNISGGTMHLNKPGFTGEIMTPYYVSGTTGDEVTVTAVEQQIGNYYMLWNDTEAPIASSKWVWINSLGQRSDVEENKQYNFELSTTNNGTTYEAGLRKRCNITFSNQFVGVSDNGELEINGNTVTGGTTTPVVEQNEVTGGAVYQNINGINYSFVKWIDASTGATVSTNEDYTFNPQEHKSLKAVYKGIPSTYGRNMYFGTARRQPIKIYWTDHINPNVTQYEIWRQVNGGTPTQIGTVNRGTTQFTDNDFMYTGSVADENLRYDVRAYYSVEDTRSLAAWGTVFGQWIPESSGNDEDALALNEVPTEFGIDNYPNPFNPSTSISFAVPEAGTYTLRVFNMLGQEVATLFNNQVSAGKYQVEFDASKLSSGIYIYNLSGSNVNISKKMMLMK